MKCFVVLAACCIADSCTNLPLDLVFVQDATGTYWEPMPKIANAMKDFMEKANSSLDDAHFGLVSFRDKPYSYLGDPYADYCYHEESRLDSEVDELFAVYQDLDGNYGADEPEASLEALVDATVSRSLGWRSESSKVLVINTDATPHDPDDYIIYNGVYDPSWPIASPVPPPTYMPVYPDDPQHYSSDNLCTGYEYPSYEQAARVAHTYQAKVLFILPSDATTKVSEKWQEINGVFEQPSDYVITMDFDEPSAAVQKLLDLLPELLTSACSTPSPQFTTEPTTNDTTQEEKTIPVTQQSTAQETTQEATETAQETTPEESSTGDSDTTTTTGESETTTTTTTTAECRPTTTTDECRPPTTTPGECRPTETTTCKIATTYECQPQTIPNECEDHPANADSPLIKLILLS